MHIILHNCLLLKPCDHFTPKQWLMSGRVLNCSLELPHYAHPTLNFTPNAEFLATVMAVWFFWPPKLSQDAPKDSNIVSTIVSLILQVVCLPIYKSIKSHAATATVTQMCHDRRRKRCKLFARKDEERNRCETKAEPYFIIPHLHANAQTGNLPRGAGWGRRGSQHDVRRLN